MSYKVLDKSHMDASLVMFLHTQEHDHYCHMLNKSRYEHMLASLPAGDFRARIERLLAETVSRLAEVDAIIASTLATSQLPDSATIDKIKASQPK